MRKYLTVIVALLASSAVGKADEPSQLQIMLLQDYAVYNEICRGGSGSETDTSMACGARDYSAYMIALLFGWCYGKQDQSGYLMRWHKCEPDSVVPTKP